MVVTSATSHSTRITTSVAAARGRTSVPTMKATASDFYEPVSIDNYS